MGSLKELLDKYRNNPQFLGIELVNVNQVDAIGDTVLLSLPELADELAKRR